MTEPVDLPPVVVYPDAQAAVEPVTLPTPDTQTTPLPPDIARQRAVKTEFGLGSVIGKTADDMQPTFEAGHEKDLRAQAAATLDNQRMQEKQQQIQKMAQTYGPLSSEQIQTLLDPFAITNQPTDPDTVIERQYAKSYIGTMATVPAFLGTENVWDMAARELPKQAAETEDVANDLTTKNQYLLTKLQNAQQLVSQQSWLGWGLDQLKGATQLYPEYKQRGLIDGEKFKGLGLGSDLEAQSNTLYRKDIPDFKATVDKAYEYLAKDNPSLAVQWLSSMQGQDTFEKTTNNFFTAMAVPDMTLGASVLKKVLTYNQVRRAARDMVQAAARDPSANPINMTAATGDLHEAAVLNNTNNVIKAIQGTPDVLGTVRNSLLTTWKDTASNFAANPGTFLSREASTRILDGIEKDGGALLDKITTMNRVERNPRILTEDVIRAQKDEILHDPAYRGQNATVLDVDGPIVEPASNTKWYRVHVGDYDSSLFSDAETAQGRRDMLGIGKVEGTAGDKLYIPEAAAKNLESVATKEGSTKFFVDGGIEVVSSPTPKAGFVPYNTKTGQFEKTLTEDTAKIEQQGLGFRIVHYVPVQETSDLNRELMIKDIHGNLIPETISHSSASGTKSIVNSILGWVRNSDETMALNESIQRKAVVYSQSNIHKWAADLNKPINKIRAKSDWWKPTAYLGKVTGRDVRSQFERALQEAQRQQAWFKGPGEMQDFYLRSFGRDPSALEVEGYFNYVKLVEGDRMLGEIAEFRNRARVGAEQHRIKFIGPDGKPIYSGLFDGVTLRRLPSNSGQVLVAGEKQGDETLAETGSFSTKRRGEIQQKLDKGELKLIEVYDMDHMPLSGLSDVTQGQRIRYVLTKTSESSPLEFNHVNKKEGGHFDWDYDHYIKQADMREQRNGKHIYVGDTTIMPIDSKSLGGKVVKMWNEAQNLIKEGKWDEAKPIVQKMGIKWEDFTGWYQAGRDAEGKAVKPKLNANEPVYVVPKGKNILSLDDSLQERYRIKDTNGVVHNRFEDGSREGLANNFKVAYNTERHTDFNFRTINDVGSKENPIYAYQPAKLIDPLPTMNKALNRAINSAFMDDYKLYAIEHWLREAETHLDVEGGKDAIRSAPFWHYHNPKFKTSTPADVKWNLLSHKYKIDSFVGTPSKFDTWVHTFTQHLADVAYNKYGPEASRTGMQKAFSITPIWLLHRVKNPVDFIRGVTFNFKLGLFNPAQFLVQAQTHALIWSLEPRHGTMGTYAMMLHGWSKVNRNPAILRSLDEYYTKLNMFGSKPRLGEFLEAQRELDKTGFEHVAGEYANLSKSYTPTTNFLTGDIEKGLKIGQTPFRLGEQSTRITAWYTAFRKFRAENPNVAITNIERGKILNDADLLTVNMSRASSSMINHGVFSLSTQFLSYQVKLAELFWSKRLGETATERAMARARMLAGFSMLYGMPNAIGVTGAPFSDNIREHLIDDLGYIPGEKWLSTMLNEGFPAWQWALITGHGDIQAGNVENVGNRFGSQGWQNIKQAMRSDIPWWQAIGGAGVTTMSNFMSSALDPFYQGAISWARGDTGDARFTIKGADLIEPLKEASSFNMAVKWWTAINSGKWISKNEGYVEDISPLRATYLTMLGMNPQNQDDMFVKNSIIKGEEEAQKKASKEFIKDWHRSIEAAQNGDPEQADQYVRNAMARFTAVGMQYEDILKYMAIASEGWESAIDGSDYSFWSKGDQSKQQQRLDMFKREQAMKEKKRAQP